MGKKQDVFDIQVNTLEYEEALRAVPRGGRREKKGISKKKISLYKTEICKSFEASASCPYGIRCQFAHSLEELRDVERHPRYKTELCKTYTARGECAYGKRCCFIHAGPKEDADLPSARNMPGDWRVSGMPEIPFCEIATDFSEKTICALTPEETEKLRLLSRYKSTPVITPRARSISRLFGRGNMLAPSTSYSLSLAWTYPHHCFVYVDASCRIAGISALGKAPGTASLKTAQCFRE